MMSKYGLFVAAILCMVIPSAAVALLGDQRDAFILIYNLIIEGATVLLLSQTLRFAGNLRMKRTGIALFCVVALLGIADFLFVARLGREPLPYQDIIGEGSYTLAFAGLIFLLGSYVLAGSQRFARLLLAGAVTLAYLGMQFVFLLRPADAAVPPFSPMIRANYYAYSVAAAGAFGLLVVNSLRTRCRCHYLFLVSFMLCLEGDFAQRYHLIVHKYASSSDATAAWVTGIGDVFMLEIQ